MPYYETIEEAERALQEEMDRPMPQCPLIRDICKKDCRCFVDGYTLLHETRWYVHGHSCDSPLISGYITVNRE